MNSTAKAADRNVQAQTAQIIPFRFEAREIRTLLIDDEPWFAAKDIIASLDYAKASKPAKVIDHVPPQWKGVNPIHTPGGVQNVLMLSEQGLYFFLGRSDKPKALPFQMWLAGEVLPTIRKHGRYVDDNGKLGALMDELGVNEINVLKGLIRDKSRVVPAEKRQGFQLAMHNRLHTRFNVQRTELIPADQFEVACNFIAAYALEGEFLGPEEPQPPARLDIDFTVAKWIAANPANFFCIAASGEVDRIDIPFRAVSGIGMNSPIFALLKVLKDAGYEVEACQLELVALKDHAQVMSGVMENLQRALEQTQARSRIWTCRTKGAAA